MLLLLLGWVLLGWALLHLRMVCVILWRCPLTCNSNGRIGVLPVLVALPVAPQPCPPTLQALAQRSDHLALIAAFNAWTAARAAGGRGAGADFARQHFLSEQVRTRGFDFGAGVCVVGVCTSQSTAACVCALHAALVERCEYLQHKLGASCVLTPANLSDVSRSTRPPSCCPPRCVRRSPRGGWTLPAP